MHPILASVLLLLVAMGSIQSGAAAAKQLFPLIGPTGASALRLWLAATILCCIWRPWRGALSRRAWGAVASYGAALGAMNLLFYLALERLPLGMAVSIEFTGPLVLAVATSRRWLDLLWVAFALAGIVMIIPRVEAPLDPLGISLALGAGACWALYMIFGRRVSNVLPSSRASALGMVVAASCVLPFAVVDAGPKLLDASLLPLAFVVAIFSSALPYSLEMIALKRLPARTFGILMSLEPAVAGLSGWLFLSERLTATQWLAAGAVSVASIGTSLSAARGVDKRGQAPSG